MVGFVVNCQCLQFGGSVSRVGYVHLLLVDVVLGFSVFCMWSGDHVRC